MEERKTINSQIFIAKLHPRVTSQDLKYKFAKCGNIKDIRVKPGYAFIDFEQAEDADKAVDRMNGKELEGQRIVVEISKRIYREKDGRDQRDGGRDRESRDGGRDRERDGRDGGREGRDRDGRDGGRDRESRDGGRDRESRDGGRESREGGKDDFPRRNGPKPNDSCFNCGKSGHWANECRDPVKPRRDVREREDLKCFKCGEKGHKQKFCPENRRRGRSDSRDRNRRRSPSYSSSRSRRSSVSSSRSKRKTHKKSSKSKSNSKSSYSSKSPRRSNDKVQTTEK